MKVYICKHCGNVITKLTSSKVPVVCCGEPMTELIPGTTDGATEKHIPVVTVEGSTVTAVVGDVIHPMVEKHFIQWIALETDTDLQVHWLQPGQEPKAVFALPEGQKAKAVYEYCNLHGLWKTEL